MFSDKGIIFLNDLRFDLDNLRSYESIKQKGFDTNFLTWTALRSSIIYMNSKSPGNLLTVGNFDPMNFEYNAKFFNAYVCKCKQIYSMLISTKAKTPNSFKKLNSSQIHKMFFLLHIELQVKRMFSHSNIEC